MSLVDRDWRLIREEAHDGPTNMAFDEVAASTAAEGGPRTIRLYRWTPSTLSLGYRQAADTVDWTFCDREGIAVTRRPTGGGGIYHDTVGDISYSIIAPASDLPGDLMETYALLLEPVLDALSRMGVAAGLADAEQPPLHEPACYLRAIDPAHDVVVGGRKLSGNAQYRQKDAVIQHGSITYARAAERHLGVFADPGVTNAQFKDRVTSIRDESGIDRAEAVETLETTLRQWAEADEGMWTAEERTAAATQADEKYADESWIRRR